MCLAWLLHCNIMDNLKKLTIIFIFSLFLFIFIEQEYFTILYAEEIIISFQDLVMKKEKDSMISHIIQ